MDYSIRKLRQNEAEILDTFLYEAIFIPEGVTAPSRDIIKQPELQVYVADFGMQKGDICYVAETENKYDLPVPSHRSWFPTNTPPQ